MALNPDDSPLRELVLFLLLQMKKSELKMVNNLCSLFKLNVTVYKHQASRKFYKELFLQKMGYNVKTMNWLLHLLV